MTRINLINVEQLTDQHLLAEYRELPRIFSLAYKHQLSNKPMPKIDSYRLGSGHVIFFYDKITFLVNRQKMLINELLSRGFSISFETVQIPEFGHKYLNDWSASIEDINLSKSRLKEKLLMRPDFYKHRSKPVGINFYD